MAETPIDTERLLRLGQLADAALAQDELWQKWFGLLWISVTDEKGLTFEVSGPSEEEAEEAVAWATESVKRRLVRASVLAAWSFMLKHSVIDPPRPDDHVGDDNGDDLDYDEELASMVTDSLSIRDPIERLKVFIHFGVLASEQLRDFELSVTAGEQDEDEAMTLDAPDVPDDHEERLHRAAEAALDAYYAPVATVE